MSDKFNGFSQDEINKLTSAGKGKNRKTGQSEAAVKEAFRSQHGGIGIRRMPEKWSKECLKKQQVNSRSTAPSVIASSDTRVKTKRTLSTAAITTTSPNPCTVDGTEEEEIDIDIGMSTSIEEALFYQQMKPTTARTASSNGHNTHTATSAADDSSILRLPHMADNVSSSTDNDADSSILGTQSLPTPDVGPIASGALNVDSPFKGISLKDFESHRRMIEEQNKQKKELLYKAIEHHSQKTAAEARKIQDIKIELTKLDNDLAADVAILRKQIDLACIHFANVEKQYMKIESQFLRTKIDLHNAAEKKELLTEHLCTVIAHNEDRKAQKLSELMEKVGLSPTGEYELLSPSASQVVDK